MSKEIEIHGYKKAIDGVLKRLRHAKIEGKFAYVEKYRGNKKDGEYRILNENRETILAYDQFNLLYGNKKRGMKVPTRLKIIDILLQLNKILDHKPFAQVTKQDVDFILLHLKQDKKCLTESTIAKYRATMKKFFKWMVHKEQIFEVEGYPENVKNLRSSPDTKPVLYPEDLLTEEEVQVFIHGAEHPRDKCFASCLYESASRISELGNAKCKHLREFEFGYILTIHKSKTSSGKGRPVTLIISKRYIKDWLNIHPFFGVDPEAPLWVKINRTAYYSNKGDKIKEKVCEPLSYTSLRSIIKQAKEKAGIKKRIYNHLFRHSRIWHLERLGMTSTSIKKLVGHSPNSRAYEQTYSHLDHTDVHNQILKMHGIQPSQQQSLYINCVSCSEKNPAQNKLCMVCCSPLNEKIALLLMQQKEHNQDVKAKLAASQETTSVLRNLFRKELNNFSTEDLLVMKEALENRIKVLD